MTSSSHLQRLIAHLPAERPTPLILLIDDEPLVRMQLRRVLEKDGYQVVEATNGKEGIDAGRRLHPDLILLDAMMPVMDGFECCYQLQALPAAAHTPILMITGLEDQFSVDRAFAVGAADYITKPFHWAVLRQRVQRLIQQSQLLQQLEESNRRWQNLASVDALTQLANRHQLDFQLEVEWRRMAREDSPLSFILSDIDFFKRYNDALGHPAGDNCLRQVAAAIKRIAKRPGDLAIRYGGEEFAIILPNTSLEGAVRVTERLQNAIQRIKIAHPNSKVSSYVTLSTGVSTTFPAKMSALLPESLITAADKALYESKAMGRNRFSVRSLT